MSNRIAIGGHRNPTGGLGVEVYRHPGAGLIEKVAHTEADIRGIQNEARMLRILDGTGFAPKLLHQAEDNIMQEDLGDNTVTAIATNKTDWLPPDGEEVRRESARLLATLRKHEIRHGDLTGSNIVMRGNRPMAIDFQQSHLFDEDTPDKRTMSDSYYFWRSMASVTTEAHPTPDTPRVIRRWATVRGALGGNNQDPRVLEGQRLLDLGCFQGDFCALAAADGMTAVGVDGGGFRTGENSIAKAVAIWTGMPNMAFHQSDITELKDFTYDVVLMFSTWAYVYNDFGQDIAYELLDRIVTNCGVLFFETQLFGDGPGPAHLVEDDDVANMLGQFGTVQPLDSFHVAGRPAFRRVFKVWKNA